VTTITVHTNRSPAVPAGQTTGGHNWAALPEAAPAPTLPDEVLQRLTALAEVANSTDWAWGDLAVEIVDELAGQMAKGETRRLIANASPFKVSTIRKREAVARFFDLATRDEFAVLDYSHFELAMRQKDWRADLEFCVDSADDYGGRPMPFNAYAALVRERSGGKPPADPYEQADKAKALLGQALDAPNVPARVRASWQAALDALLEE
jgi:hypothetical protein